MPTSRLVMASQVFLVALASMLTLPAGTSAQSGVIYACVAPGTALVRIVDATEETPGEKQTVLQLSDEYVAPKNELPSEGALLRLQAIAGPGHLKRPLIRALPLQLQLGPAVGHLLAPLLRLGEAQRQVALQLLQLAQLSPQGLHPLPQRRPRDLARGQCLAERPLGGFQALDGLAELGRGALQGLLHPARRRRLPLQAFQGLARLRGLGEEPSFLGGQRLLVLGRPLRLTDDVLKFRLGGATAHLLALDRLKKGGLAAPERLELSLKALEPQLGKAHVPLQPGPRLARLPDRALPREERNLGEVAAARRPAAREPPGGGEHFPGERHVGGRTPIPPPQSLGFAEVRDHHHPA